MNSGSAGDLSIGDRTLGTELAKQEKAPNQPKTRLSVEFEASISNGKRIAARPEGLNEQRVSIFWSVLSAAACRAVSRD